MLQSFGIKTHELAAVADSTPAYYCRNCDYPLLKLDRNRCPECGRPFDPLNSRTIGRHPHHRRRRFILKSTLSLTLAAILFSYITLFLLVPCGFSYWSVCTECGMIQNMDQRRLPLTPIMFSTSRSLQGTALSAVFARDHFRQGHVHQWSFGTGGDFGLSRSCALGNGRNLRTLVNSPEVCALVDGLIRFADPQSRDRWLKVLLDPFRGRWIEQALNTEPPATPPAAPFSDAASFNKWWEPIRQQIEKDVLPLFVD
jgi:hypothetical protein